MAEEMKTYQVLFKSGTLLKIKAHHFDANELTGRIEFYKNETEIYSDIYVVNREVAAIVPEPHAEPLRVL